MVRPGEFYWGSIHFNDCWVAKEIFIFYFQFLYEGWREVSLMKCVFCMIPPQKIISLTNLKNLEYGNLLLKISASFQNKTNNLVTWRSGPVD